MSGVVSAIGNALGDVAEMVGDGVSEFGGGFRDAAQGLECFRRIRHCLKA